MTHTDSVEAAEEIARALSQSIRYSCGKGQYDAQPDCQAAYLDGVETAIAMMYIDLTGGHKSKGILGRLFATSSQQVEAAVRKERERIREVASVRTRKLKIGQNEYARKQLNLTEKQIDDHNDYCDAWEEGYDAAKDDVLQALTPNHQD